jgi:zinc protease
MRPHRRCCAALRLHVFPPVLAAALLILSALPAAAVDIQKVAAGGVEAWLVEDHANPILSVRIGFRGAGSSADRDDKAGLARMTAALLDEGAGDLDSQAFQRKLEDLSIRLSFDADRDNFGGTLTTLSANRDIAFDLLRLSLTDPRFDAEPVERIRNQLEARLRLDDEDPEARANRRLWAALFPDSPYGRPPLGTPESLRRIERADLVRFAEQRLARDNMVLGVVGDVTPGQLATLLQETFGELRPTAVPNPMADVRPAGSGKVVVIDMDVPQSAVAFAQEGLKRNDPRFYALTVLNQILGGGDLSSRLFEEVREKRGLVYGVYTTPVPLDHAALIMGGAATANERVAQTLSVIREEWRTVARKGVTEQELADGKTFLTGSFALRFAGSARLAGLLASIRLEDLGIDYLDRRNRLIEAVTLDDVNRLAAELLHADRVTFVVVGRPEGLRPAP